MKCVILKVPVHRPVIHHLAPVLDRGAHFRRHVVRGNYKIGKRQRELALLHLAIHRERAQLKEIDIALLDRFLLQHLARNFLEGRIHPRFGGNLLCRLIHVERDSHPSTSAAGFCGELGPLPLAFHTSAAMAFTSARVTGASTAATCTIRPPLTPCSQTWPLTGVAW